MTCLPSVGMQMHHAGADAIQHEVRAMAREFHIESRSRCRDGEHRVARISFSNRMRMESMLMPALKVDSLEQFVEPSFELDLGRRPRSLTNVDMFFARLRELQEAGARWVAERVQGTLAGNGISTIGVRGGSGHSGAVHLAGRRADHSVRFMARVSDAIDPNLKEVGQQVGEQAEEVKDDVVDVAQESRVPVPSAKLPFIGFVRSLTIKNLVCGIVAGAVAANISIPFDVVRTRAIAGQGGRTTAEVVNTVFRKEGVQSILLGDLKINMLQNGIEKGFQFATFEFVKRYQRRHSDDGRQQKVLPLPRQIPVATAGGAAGGFVGTVVGYPLQPVFDRVLLAPDKYKNLWGAATRLVKEEGGFRELFRGVTPALIAIVPSAAVSFYTYETLTDRYLPKRKLSPQAKAVGSLAIGAVAGAASAVITYPLELARTEIILSILPSKAVHLAEGRVVYNNTWQALTGITKSQGFRGLYRGLPAQTLMIVPMTAVTFMVYELTKMALVAEGEEERDELKG